MVLFSRSLVSHFKMTPLHLSSKQGHPEVVKLLLRSGASFEAADQCASQHFGSNEEFWRFSSQLCCFYATPQLYFAACSKRGLNWFGFNHRFSFDEAPFEGDPGRIQLLVNLFSNLVLDHSSSIQRQLSTILNLREIHPSFL
jgi:hypothetical protein